jgi:ABC-type branched-subunit amino acid transport system ATPase component
MGVLLSTEDLSKSFGAVQALDGVTVTISEGEFVGVIGPNGSGKTTLFNTITGFHRPTAGRVMWAGQDVTGYRPEVLARAGLARTFQSVMTFQSESVLANVAIACETCRRPPIPGIPEDAQGILEYCGLIEFADHNSGSLPYGIGRRLNVALVLAIRPKMIMLDEPASGLNDVESADLSKLLRKLGETGITLVLIDHDMSFLTPLVQRIIVLDAGRKLTEGGVDEVRANPAVVTAYLGSGVLRSQRPNAALTSVSEADVTDGDQRRVGTRDLVGEGIRAGYGPNEVLHGLDVRVEAGEAVGILGANGAGKTTLMRAISGSLELSGGRVSFGDVSLEGTRGRGGRRGDRPVSRLLGRDRGGPKRMFDAGLVTVPEGRHIFSALSVRDNLLVAGKGSKPERLETAEWVAEQFPALKTKWKASGGSLSGGQQQMLAIGRGLMAKPRLLCLDEPSLGLAPAVMESLTERIGELRSTTGLSLLLVEQSMSMALALTERVYVMQDGAFVMSAKSEEVSVSDLASAYLGAKV